MGIKVIEDFLSEKQLSDYLVYARQTDSWVKTQSNDVWSDRVIYHHTITQFTEFHELYLDKIKWKIILDLDLQQEIWPDYLGLVRWRTGDWQAPHADGQLESGEKHPYFWRDFGCVWYLNDDYEGGEIYFPKQNIELKPKPNTLVFFPGTTEYLHGVKPITNGIRYTLTSFWTYDITYSMKK